MKLEASTRLLADSVIAPSDSYKHENENKLKDWQHESQQTDHADNDPSTNASSTAVSQGPHALPQTESNYARLLSSSIEDDQLTTGYEDACVGSDTSDGIVPNSEVGFPLRGEDTENNYMNVRGCDEEEMLADADPKLWNTAYQPMG
jgi:hypothetical protein